MSKVYLVVSKGAERARHLIAENELAAVTVGQLRSKAATEMGGQQEVNLLLRGQILKDDEATLEKAGVRRGATVYAVKCVTRTVADEDPDVKPEAREPSDDEISNLFVAFGMAMSRSDLAAAVKKITNKRETLETLAATCPGLAQDHLAMAILSKPEMLALLMKKDVLKRLARERPVLFDALNVLAGTVHEEQAMSGSVSGAGAAAGPARSLDHVPFAYALDNMDDDEGEDDEGMDYEGMPPPAAATAGGGAITSDALTAALAQAQAGVAGGAANPAANNNVFGSLFSVSNDYLPPATDTMTCPFFLSGHDWHVAAQRAATGGHAWTSIIISDRPLHVIRFRQRYDHPRHDAKGHGTSALHPLRQWRQSAIGRPCWPS